MKNFVTTCIVIALFTNCAHAQLPTLSNKEKKEGWILLFDGKTSAGWKSYRNSPFPEKGWVIENGVLTIDSAGKGGDIITEEQFSNFELSIEFRVTKGANSGIKYFILPRTNLGCEFQILDDENHPDAKLGKPGTRLQGSLYDVIVPKGKKDKPIGKWNHARIIANGNHVEHWLNGTKVVEYERGSDAFKAMVAESKFKGDNRWSTPTQSPILLQDHGDAVSFRNIKIKKLPDTAVAATSKTVESPKPILPLVVNINYSQAPETREWAEKAQKIAQEQFSVLVALLDSDGFIPRDSLTIIFRPMDGVAHATGKEIHISAEWVTVKSPDDFGMVFHELVHIIQAYRSRVPSWVTEGIADYLRFFVYERNGERTCRVNPDRAKYTDSYRITGAFFNWIVLTHDAGFIKRLNTACRSGNYSVDLFKDYTGMTVDELWDGFILSIRNKNS